MLIVKLDIAKAFDSLSWFYLLDSLRTRGFGNRWTEWISMILASSHPRSYSTVHLDMIFNTGAGYARVTHSPLPLQHCHRSPPSTIRGRGAWLQTSLYAGDAAIFIAPRKEEIDALIQILSWFGDVTRLHINLQKRCIVPIICEGVDLDSVLINLPAQRTTFPIKYLGPPFFHPKKESIYNLS